MISTSDHRENQNGSALVTQKLKYLYLFMIKPTGCVKWLNHGRSVCQKQSVASSTHHHWYDCQPNLWEKILIFGKWNIFWRIIFHFSLKYTKKLSKSLTKYLWHLQGGSCHNQYKAYEKGPWKRPSCIALTSNFAIVFEVMNQSISTRFGWV